jgi:hypothetical protein
MHPASTDCAGAERAIEYGGPSQASGYVCVYGFTGGVFATPIWQLL